MLSHGSILAAPYADISLASNSRHSMCFYEKVMKVKADVAAVLNSFATRAIVRSTICRDVKGQDERPFGAPLTSLQINSPLSLVFRSH